MTRRSDSGFTLIEVLVCAVLLALGSAAVSSLITAAFVHGDGNNAALRAADLATQEMEDLRSLDYATTLASRTAPNSPETATGTSYTIQSTVTRDSPAPNMSAIQVTVTWAQRGRNHSYDLRSIYADTRN